MLFLLGVICISVIGNALPIINPSTIQRNLSPEVQTGQGPVVGSESEDGQYFEFYGIPFADTTAGSNRFKAPLPPPLFTEVFTADRRNVNCLRPLGDGFEGTEDCLVVDIFTPSLDETSSLPVMVWVRGSEFTDSNKNDLSFKSIVEKDVIVVSVHSRRSIFGFLCLGTETAPGNAGLKDIIAGLRWVRGNIANFGGDPENITLFGHGSSASVVDLVTLSPMAEGLIQKAIAQSGSALAPWAVSRDNSASAVQVAEALGHTDFTTIEELSEIFTRVSASALMAVINEFDLTDNSLVFAPCVEREISEVEPFLLSTPFEIISEGRFLQIPFMTGFVDNEGTIRAEEIGKPEWLIRMEDSFEEFLQPDLEFENDNERNRVASEIRTFYFEGDLIPQSVQRAITYHGDTMVLVSAIREARLRSVSSTTPLYLYQFSYQGSLGQPFVGPIEVTGAAHSEELAYLLYDTPPNVEIEEIPARDLAVADILIERWTNFAKTGEPTSETSQIEWQPFTIENPRFLHILDPASEEENVVNSSLEVDLSDPHPDVVAFWNEIYEEHFLDAQSNWVISGRDEIEIEDATAPSPDDGTTPPPGAGTTPPPDAGTTPPPDAGTTSPPDAGTTSPPDAGTTSPPDAGTTPPTDAGTTPAPDAGTTPAPEELDPTTEAPEETDGDGDGLPDSASTAVGYTFMIVAAFALLDKFHLAQILS